MLVDADLGAQAVSVPCCPLARTQVTAAAVRLVNAATRTLQHQWTPPAPLRITVAALTPSQVLVATGSSHLVYLQIEDNQLVERGYAVASTQRRNGAVAPTVQFYIKQLQSLQARHPRARDCVH